MRWKKTRLFVSIRKRITLWWLWIHIMKTSRNILSANTDTLIDRSLTGTTVFWLTRNLWCSICRSILDPLTRRCPMPEPSTRASHGAMHLSCGDNARGRRSRRRMRCPQPKYWRSPVSVCPHHLGPGRSTTYPRANLPDGQTVQL